MHKDSEKSFVPFEPGEPPAGLFDRIILAIKREQELRQTRKLLFSFLFLLVVSFVATPFAWTVLMNQVKSSGVFYFVSTAISDFGTFLALWKDFGLAILESLPLTGMLFFIISLGISVFTLRLFLRKKQFLFKYLTHNFSTV